MNAKGSARVWGVVIGIIIILAAAAIVWWFVSGNDTTTSTSTNTSTAKTANEQQVRANWVKFFSGATPAATKVSLLQNGSQFSQYVEAQSQSQTAKGTTATVTDVSVSSDGKTATVTYTINENGTPALKNQTGQAVLENGTWKVSDAAFCQLLQLSGNVPPACPGASTQNSSNTTQQSMTNTSTQ